ncbi:hypothetical protein [Streptomyces sp. NPDC088847]|uniref:hypothetical protein n=1 Tax=Streptomyces sp. NPDC088847 TaxID=3365909 RepID=UPI00382352ED
MSGPTFDRLARGNEAGIADRVLSCLAELDDQQRDAVTQVIGDALAHDTQAAGSRYLGQLWLRDAETTAWHVLRQAPGARNPGEPRAVPRCVGQRLNGTARRGVPGGRCCR